ncbi:MAG: TRAP transporter large permease [Pseudomonadota bacterium]
MKWFIGILKAGSPWSIIIALMVLILAAVPVAAVLGLLSMGLDEVFMRGRLSRAMGEFVWEQQRNFLLIAIPMYILMGEIILRSGIGQRMYSAVALWLNWLPGGLMHANVVSCSIFAATSGSSVATAATIGTVAYPEIEKRSYKESLFLGSIAAGGTLGILIPPSIILILFGFITDTSVPELFLAGVIPGLTLAILFLCAILIACVIRPSWGGEKSEATWEQRIRTLPDLLPPLLLIIGVMGSIYTGWATPTEAAALGVIFALLLAGFFRALSFELLLRAFEGTMRITAMIMFIIMAAVFLNFILGFIGVSQALIGFIGDLGWSSLQTMIALIIFYLILGMFMETLSMLLTTVPVVFPLVVSLELWGMGPAETGVWFGILITILMEAALITPPIGVNLYVVQGIRQRPGPFGDVAWGAIPFVLMMIVMVFLLLFIPDLALWLPRQVIG